MTQPASTSGLLPGFADPIGDSQQSFRGMLDAMARPGSVRRLSLPQAVPEGWAAAVTSLGLSLFDQDTPVWLDSAAATEEACRFLRFHCGCPIVGEPGNGAFIVIANPAEMPPLHTYSAGDPLYPERSATVIVMVNSLSGGPPRSLSGPGIQDNAVIAPAGLPDGFSAQWADNHTLYPSGVDVILAAGEEVLCLPRGVEMKEG